ncbi:hypothetical protein AOLI_G00076260 [Acnodon oligacanthus]
MSEDTKAILAKLFLYLSHLTLPLSVTLQNLISHSERQKKKKHMDIKVAKPAHVRGPEEVIKKCHKVLKTFSKVSTMTEAFNRQNVDHGTIAFTAAIAELAIVDPNTYESLASTTAKEILAAFAKKCAANITE